MIHVSARRWFNPRDGEFVGGRSGEYGYGEHYLHTAGVVLGLDDPYQMNDWRYRKENNVTHDVADVARKKDLH